MNILFLMGQYPSVGGVEKVSTVLSNEFVRRGHRVDIVSFEQPDPEIAVRELNKSVRLHALSFPVNRKKNLTALRDIVRNRKIDFIISQWAVPFYVARLCRKAIKGTDCKLITVHHNLPDTNARIKAVEIDIANHRGNKFVNRAKLAVIRTISRISLRMVYNLSDRYILLSGRFKQLTRKYMYGVNGDKLDAIANPLTIPDETSENYVNKQKEIIYVGRIEYNQKRTYRIIDIWKNIHKKFPDWNLTIIGDGPDREDLENRIRNLNLDRVRIVGFADPVPYYKRASLLLMTSEYEGLPLVLVEALKYGCVPVALDTFASIHDIINKKNGLKIEPPFGVEKMSHAVSALIIDEEQLQQMSMNARQSVAKFSLKSIADRWEELFQSMNKGNNESACFRLLHVSASVEKNSTNN